MKMKLSVVLATRNEEENIARCLESVKKIFADLPAGEAGEIIVFDEYSTDNTKKIAESFDAKVFLEPHHDIFHITKQKAIDTAKGEWVLQMDADEVVSEELAKQILQITNNQHPIINNNPLFERHQKLIEERDGKIGKDTGEIVAYFIPRRNMFLGKPLIHAGVYPDGVIRLIKKGKAYLPAKSVHEQMVIDGRVGWLSGDLLHYDSPTLARYLSRLNRYTDLHAQELKSSKLKKNVWSFLQFTILHPTYYFLLRYVRHGGYKDGVNGFLWSFFSALHFPIAYFKYVTDNKK
ncbi:MAG: glycosyltransferase family 2 protein [Patescibacteria group bacterium]